MSIAIICVTIETNYHTYICVGVGDADAYC